MSRRTTCASVFSHVWSKTFASGRRTASVAAQRRVRPGLECLEDRLVPAVINVNTLADIPLNQLQPGQITLRDAIQIANTNGEASNTINLTLPGVYQISLAGTPGETDNQAGEFAIQPTAGNLTIQNTSGGSVVVDGGGKSRVFDINPNFDPANPTKAFTVTLQGFTIENGFVTDAANPDGPNASGGGIRDVGNASLTLNNMVITGNSATADGGGVSMENTQSTKWTLTLNNTTVSNNHAGDAGGGIDEDGSGKVFVNSSTITGNSSVNQGAGIWLDAVVLHNDFQTANLTVTGSVVSDNSATAANNVGGGIGNAGNGIVTITGSTIANNFSGGVGGGFGDENAQGTLIVVDSTFADNNAIGNGGGIEASGPSMTIADSTITGNISQAQGGGVNVASATTLTINNTIVAGNFANNNGGMNFQGTAPDVFAAVTSGKGNFIGIGDANLTGITNGTNSNHVGTAAAPLNPLLGALQNNGGPTPTEAPLPGSPVIDAGATVVLANTSTDQRGFSRVANGAVDIGAVEFQDASLSVAITPASGKVPVGGTASFAITVTNASGHALPADNSTLNVTLSGGLSATSPLSFNLAALGAGQSQTFVVTATANTLGTQSVTASLTNPDSMPNGVLASASINIVTPAPTTSTHSPVGGLTLFGFGLGPTGLDLFEVDSIGEIFAMPLFGGGSPIFLSSSLNLPFATMQNGQILALLAGANGQNDVVDIINPFVASVESAVLAALHL